MNQNQNITDKELDALFAEASANGSIPPFDEGYWSEMEALLPQKKRKGAFFWYTLSAASVVVALGGIYGIYYFNETSGADLRSSENTISREPHDNKINTPSKDLSKKALFDTKQSLTSITDPPKLTEKEFVSTETPEVMEIKPLVEEKINNHKEVVTVNEPKADETYGLGVKPINFTPNVALNAADNHTSSMRKLPVYLEFGLGYGQSYQHVDFENNWMSQFRLGAGIYQELDQMQLSAGIAVRADLPSNIYRTSNTSGTSQSGNVEVQDVTAMNGLYSLEFPLFVGGMWGRSSLGAVMVPGIQMGYSGSNTRYENGELVSRNKTAGNVPDSKTMTMEIGGRYAYSLTENVQLWTSCSVDVIRPFQSPFYAGESRNYPVSFFFGLRRTF